MLQHLLFWSLAAMHADDDRISVEVVGYHPERLTSCLVWLNLFLDELGIASFGVPQDLGAIICLDSVRLVLERQVSLCRVCDRANVEDVLLRPEKSVHGDRESALGSLTAVDGDHVVMAALLRDGKELSCLVCFYHIFDFFAFLF